MKSATHMPVLVTGASGFIGGHLVRRLIECGCHVSCLTRATSPVDGMQSIGAQLVTGDVTDRRSVERALAHSQARTVFHVAGLVRARHPDDFMRVNAGGVENVTAACADRTAPPDFPDPPVLVVVSSLAAAGPCAAQPQRVEGDIPAPVSNYGRSKLAGEQAAAKYSGVVPITIVRPPIVFGPGDRAVLEIFRPIARWGAHVVPGAASRGTRLSLIHVNDLVEGLLLAAEKGERLPHFASEHATQGQGIYFIAGEEHPTYAQLGQAIATALGKKPPAVIYVPAPLMKLIGISADVVTRIRGRAIWLGSDKITEALAGSWTCSSAKAQSQLGWSPAANLADRLHETVRWYQQMGWL